MQTYSSLSCFLFCLGLDCFLNLPAWLLSTVQSFHINMRLGIPELQFTFLVPTLLHGRILFEPATQPLVLSTQATCLYHLFANPLHLLIPCLSSLFQVVVAPVVAAIAFCCTYWVRWCWACWSFLLSLPLSLSLWL